jgi:hypothetical protein
MHTYEEIEKLIEQYGKADSFTGSVNNMVIKQVEELLNVILP